MSYAGRFLFVAALCAPVVSMAAPGFDPGQRVLLDAHNCYPYDGLFADRVDRALATGVPLAIENDLGWFVDPATGKGRVVLAHGKPKRGDEPTLRDAFFEKVRPIVEKALADGNKGDWPLITLNINDIRGEDAGYVEAVWNLTGEYEAWLCTAVKQAEPDPVAPLDVKPVLVLTSGGKKETEQFYTRVPVGGKLRLFGSGIKGTATNFRRWLNFAWNEVEPEGQKKAGEWTPEDAARLKALVDDAHARGYWIRIYTLNGHSPVQTALSGWGPGYNFGSIDAVKTRWKAVLDTGVDFVATDQYEEFTTFAKENKK